MMMSANEYNFLSLFRRRRRLLLPYKLLTWSNREEKEEDTYVDRGRRQKGILGAISNCLFRNETLVAMNNDKSDNKQGGTN